MTNSGAFAYLRGSSDSFTLVKVTPATHDQTTGARVAEVRAESTIKGALDATTEEDLQVLGIAQVEAGIYRFWTEESYGVNPGDVILEKDSGGNITREWRVLQRMTTGPLVRRIMGNNADPIGFYLEATKTRRGS